MPPEGIIAEGVEGTLGERLLRARPMGGGCIGEVYRAELSSGMSVVAKVDRAGESHLEREAYMLRYLREKSELPVPEVYHSSERILLMEFMPGGGDVSGAQVHAAELLASLHGVTAGAYGHERDTLIGSLSQPNPWTESWVEFFRDQRLLYLAEVANEAGTLPANLRDRIEKLAGRLGELLRNRSAPPWSTATSGAGTCWRRGTR